MYLLDLLDKFDEVHARFDRLEKWGTIAFVGQFVLTLIMAVASVISALKVIGAKGPTRLPCILGEWMCGSASCPLTQ